MVRAINGRIDRLRSRDNGSRRALCDIHLGIVNDAGGFGGTPVSPCSVTEPTILTTYVSLDGDVSERRIIALPPRKHSLLR